MQPQRKEPHIHYKNNHHQYNLQRLWQITQNKEHAPKQRYNRRRRLPKLTLIHHGNLIRLDLLLLPQYNRKRQCRYKRLVNRRGNRQKNIDEHNTHLPKNIHKFPVPRFMPIPLVQQPVLPDNPRLIKFLPVVPDDDEPGERQAEDPDGDHGDADPESVGFVGGVPALDVEVLVEPELLVEGVAVEEADCHGGDGGVYDEHENDDAQDDSVTHDFPAHFEAGDGFHEEPENDGDDDEDDWEYAG